MPTHSGPNIVESGLIFAFDASDINSYPGTGNIWYNVKGTGYNMSLINGPSYTSGPLSYFSLDGTNQRIQHGNLPSINVSSNNYTFELWFRLPVLPTINIDSSSSGRAAPLYGARFGSDFQLFAYPASNGQSNLGVCFDDSRANNNHRSTRKISANEWVQFVQIGIPYSGIRGSFRYYTNGNLDKGTTNSSDTNGYSIPNTMYIGYDARYGKYNQMDITLLRRYNRALTANEVKQNYNATKSRFGL